MNNLPAFKRGFHIIHQNCQSIKNKVDVVKLQIQKTGFDCFTLSETWLTDDYPDSMLSIDGYNIARHDRTWKNTDNNITRKGGGVLVYIKNTLSFTTNELAHLNPSNKDIEIQWIKIINPHSRNYIIGNTYRPPQGDPQTFVTNIVLNLG